MLEFNGQLYPDHCIYCGRPLVTGTIILGTNFIFCRPEENDCIEDWLESKTADIWVREVPGCVS